MSLSSMLNLQLLLFALMLIGAYATKRKLIDAVTRRYLTDLLLEIFLPCTIIASFDMDVTKELLKSSLEVLLVSFAIQLFLLLISKVLFYKIPHSKQVVLRYGTIVSNSAFLGLPIISQVLGPQAVIFGSIALIPVRIFMWTSGMSLFIKTSLREAFKKLIIHPCIIAVYLGFAVLMVPFKIPDFIMNTVSGVGECTTIISMFLIGSFLAEINIKTIFNKYIAYFALIRLIIIPLIVLGFMTILKMDQLVTGVVVVFSAMPAGSTTAILAAKYGADSEFASKVVFVTTLLSLITIPIFCFYLL